MPWDEQRMYREQLIRYLTNGKVGGEKGLSGSAPLHDLAALGIKTRTVAQRPSG